MVSRCVLRLVGVLAFGLVTAGCTSGDAIDSSAEGTKAGSPTPTRLNVMSFNIEYGGEGVDFGSVSKAIEAADADVVAIQEGFGNIPEIAGDLGWDYYDTRAQVVSKYPLLSQSDPQDRAVFVEVEPGAVAALINLHLSSTKYGPQLIDKGRATAAEVLRNENALRLPELEPVLDEASSLTQRGIPVFVTGDFNAPSHRDWTAATVGLRDHMAFPLQWPTSVAAEAAGLVDAYRALSPDPVEDPGLTWPASRPFVPGYNPGPNGAAADRIDLMFTGGPVEPVEARIVGEKGSAFTDVAVSPWPTDHRALVVRAELLPAAPPTLVTIDQRLVTIGQERNVRYVSDSGDAATLAVVPAAGGVEDAAIEQQLDNAASGSWLLPTQELEQGAYDLVLLDGDGAELARSPFWLIEPGATPQLTTDKRVYAPSEPIEVTWLYAPGNKWDWLGIYDRGADPEVASYTTWTYTGGTIAGTEILDGSDFGGPWPLSPGAYSVYLLVDDSYEKVAGTDFDVRR